MGGCFASESVRLRIECVVFDPLNVGVLTDSELKEVETIYMRWIGLETLLS